MDDSDSYFHKRHYLLVFWITHTFLQINIFSWWKFCVERSWQGGGEGSVSQSVWHSLAPVACFCLAVRIPSSFISPLSRSDQQPKCRNLTESWCSTERIIGQKLKMGNAWEAPNKFKHFKSVQTQAVTIQLPFKLIQMNTLYFIYFKIKFKTLSIVENGSLGGLNSPKTGAGGCEGVSERLAEI